MEAPCGYGNGGMVGVVVVVAFFLSYSRLDSLPNENLWAEFKQIIYGLDDLLVV